ncbi:MAG: IS110 family transposase [Bacteroidales bacterium]|nr:IS110 family transposase [Bacteroidales bacterium]
MKRHFIAGKYVVGIDPSKEKSDAAVIDAFGLLKGKTFSFQNNHQGFQKQLWIYLNERIPGFSKENSIFAIEAACNLWQKLADYINNQGYTVVILNPLSTYKARSLINHSFSKTDAKDALVVANSAREGYFDYYRIHSDKTKAMHDLAVTYDKLKRSLTQTKLRLRGLVELTFPEFPEIIKLSTNTALFLLEHYITPQEFLDANIFTAIQGMEKASRKQKGVRELKELQEAARTSIGLDLDKEQIKAAHMARDAWIAMIKLLFVKIDEVQNQIIAMAKEKPYYSILTSIKGISDISASLFIAELRDLYNFQHYKQIEAFAGIGLRNWDSGQYKGYRHISRIGNKRLRSIIFRMTTETKNHIPEVRIRFLNRKMIHDRHRKNIIACASNLLKLIMTLIQENRPYEFREEKVKELQDLELKFEQFKEKKKVYKKAS